MGVRQYLISCIPDAYYSDGKQANCLIFKICNMFDIDSHSFKEVKKTKIVKTFKIDSDNSVEISNVTLDGHKIGIKDGKVIVKK